MDHSRYLVGVDGSSPAGAALDWAARHARRDGAELELVHVVDPEAGMMGIDLQDEAEEAGERIIREAERIVHDAFPELAVSAELATGVPAWTLAQRAHDGDTIVVGTGKTGYASGRLLGSRSVQFALAAPGSVAVVPEVDLRFREGVVAGIDRAETAALVARRAAEEAKERGTRLTLIHAVPPEAVRGARSRVEGPLVLAAEAARQVADHIEIRSRISTRPAAEALLDASRGAALLVVGPGSTGPARSPIGSTLHGVLINANAPVLVVRP
ncbi:universal stress protein [Homoserinibacter sp. GY 40078]|uniref:universal stress protein n=1 Tax=Homoserinibacter sp. GY 40078 TaxID=2603275 RepID=UPI0011CB9C70|nr:universal stress protein [Homoserinibacter sp. GY 40078]TXK19672.1 universal stress protein [Homoserinibacter sp. GY 40078]